MTAADGAATDADAPTDSQPTFFDLQLSEPVLAAIRDIGYETPSAIQAATIPPLLEGRDVVGLAQTGTGKTAAFALPILSRIDPDAAKPQALVLSPTRELALQVSEAFEQYASHMRQIRLLPVYGGQSYSVQLNALRRGVHVVVGTPGRVIDHLRRGTLDLSDLKHLVLDEADEMLKMGFAEDVETILADTPDDKQVALFSATMPRQIREISQKYLTDAEEITIARKTTTAANISQRYLTVAYPQKVDALTRILEVEEFDGMIVFVRTKNETEVLADKLRARGFSATAINGDVPQAQRERTVGQLRDGSLDILVATDVAARGLDVERISHVINFDIPVDTESYVHRIGRTGRAGRSGSAISFVTPRERRLLKAIEKATRQPLEQMQLPTVDEINVTRLGRFDDAITAALGQEGRISRFRDIIGHYVTHHDVPEADVAAALAVVAQGDTPLLLSPEDEMVLQTEAKRGEGRKQKRTDAASGRTPSGAPLAPYRLEVGRRQHVQPGQIVGALANEGGLSRGEIGAIQIRQDFSIVELPADLGDDVFERLGPTRVGGAPIRLKRDRGGGPRGGQGERRPHGDRKPHRGQGPRYDAKPHRKGAPTGPKKRKPRHKG